MDSQLPSDVIESLPSLLPYATEPELKQLEKDLAATSPGSFAQIASQGRWLPARHLSYLDAAIVDSIAQAEAGKLEGLVVSMPPQHGKSMLCSHYLPAWYLGKYPDRRVILTSYESDFATSWGRKARDLLKHWGALFGVSVSRRSGAANRWDLDGREGGMTSAGVRGPITGKGAHLLIIDDPIKNDEEARSATFRQKQWDWWQSVATTRLRPGALIIIIQTRWHRDDLTGRILRQAIETDMNWRVVKFPALAEEEDVLGRQPDEALWPDDYFKPDIWFNEWPDRWACKAVALDPSKGVNSKFGDYSAFVLTMVFEGKIYVDADLAIRNTAVIAETAMEIQQSFQPDWFGIETNQFHELLAGDILRRSRERRMHMPLYMIDNRVNKLVRIRRLTPLLSRKAIRFKGGSPGAKLLVEQMRDFPNGDHDDGPDALEMAVRLSSQLLNQVPDQTTYTQIVLG